MTEPVDECKSDGDRMIAHQMTNEQDSAKFGIDILATTSPSTKKTSVVVFSHVDTVLMESA